MSRRWLWIAIAIVGLGIGAAYPGFSQSSSSDALATGFGYVSMGWLPEAARQFVMAARQDPGDPESLLLAGVVQHVLGRTQDGFRYLQRSADAAGDYSPEIWALVGDAHLALGNLTRAEAAFQRALAEREGLALAHRGLAVIAERRGDLAEAKKQWEAVLEIAPTLAWDRMQLARLLLAEERWEEALEHLLQVARQRPRDGEVQYLSALAYLRLEERERAIHALKRTLQLDPEHREAGALLEQLSH